MIQLVQDFTRFDQLPEATPWQRRIRAELRFVQTLSNASSGKYEPLLEKALHLLQDSLSRDGVISNAAAQAAEAELLPAAEEAKSFEFLCAAHAHIDMNWMWGFDETVNATIDTFRTMLQIMKEYPDFKFSQSQASVYRILERFAPEMLEEVRARVAEGRWELTASAWVETDKNMANGESLSRHILYAKNYLSKLFDINPDSLEVDFDPDTFGHNRNVPEIAANGGIRYYYHCRGRIGEQILNRWRAPSGSELILYTEPFWYNGEMDTTLAEHAVKLAEITGSKTLLKVYGVGDHGGGPTRRDLDRLIEMNSWPVYPKFTFSTFHEYFHTVEARRDTLPVLEGEMNFLCDGCYTTQTRIKAGNRRSERILQDAELFDAVSVLRTGAKPHPEIFAEAWEKVLFNHFHDIIPGSGVTETREYASGLYQEVAGAAGARRKAAFYRLTEQMNTASLMEPTDISFSRGEGGGAGFGGVTGECSRNAGKTRIFHLFNSSPWDRTAVTEFVVWDYEGEESRLAVRLPEGEWLETQLLEQGDYWGHHFAKVLAEVSVPASGWTTVLIGEKPVEPSCSFRNDMRVQHPETFLLENDQIRAEFNPATASLTSLFDKETGRELIPEGQEGRFELATEAVWKEVTGWHGGMSAWFTGRQKKVVPLTCSEMRPLSSGKLRQRLEILTKFGNGSDLRVEVSLDRGSKFLQYHVTCNWREFGSDPDGIPCLQFTLPTVSAGKDFLYEVPLGFTRREGQEMDLPATRFVMAKDDSNAVILAAQEKYGYRTANGRMAITLIRGAYAPDPTPEIGCHEIHFGILAEHAGKTNRDYAAQVQDSEHPIFSVSGLPHSGTLDPNGSFLRVMDGNVLVSGAKISEDGKALILRLYETEEKAGSFTVDCGFVPTSVTFADQLERPIDGGSFELSSTQITASIGACQLRILRIEF
ncbi:MAG: glycoside hydrolase family 38 C-terminal domain-containing protein [Candidatus Merdivicinus sp.]|jgi:alpha-mannosidase